MLSKNKGATMKILIIGANGRMGKKVASLCKKQNIEYVGVDPNSQNCKINLMKIVKNAI